MTTTEWVTVPREPDAAQLAMGESILESVNSGHPVNGDVFCRSMYLAMISASPSPISLEEIVEVLRSLLFSARLLHQNSEICIEQHHGLTPSETGWFASCLKSIESAEAVIAKLETSNG